MGLLKKRCFYEVTGIEYVDLIDDYSLCKNNSSCNEYGEGLICGKMLDNPNWNLTNFDTFGWSFMSTF